MTVPYTDEVLAALSGRGFTADPDDTDDAPLPPGCVRFLIAVGEAHQEGVAAPTVVAALLRAQADALDTTTTTRS